MTTCVSWKASRRGHLQRALLVPIVAEMVDPAPRDPALATLADLELGRVLGRGVSGRVLRVRDRRTAAT